MILIVKYVVYIPCCHGKIRKIVYEVGKDACLIKNGELLPYKFLGSFSGPIALGNGENSDLEMFFPSLESDSNSEKVIKKGDYILAERVDDSIPDRKYMLTECVAEIWDD